MNELEFNSKTGGVLKRYHLIAILELVIRLGLLVSALKLMKKKLKGHLHFFLRENFETLSFIVVHKGLFDEAGNRKIFNFE